MLTIAIIALAFFLNSDRFVFLSADEPYQVYDIFGMTQFYRLVLRVVVVTSIATPRGAGGGADGPSHVPGSSCWAVTRSRKAEERVVLTMDLVRFHRSWRSAWGMSVISAS